MIIYGAGSLGKIILAELINDKFPNGEVIFFDENEKLPDLLYNKYKVIKNFEELKKIIASGENNFIPAIGHPRLREKAVNKVVKAGGKLLSVISSEAFISKLNFNTFEGLFAPRWAGISHDTSIGKSCIMHHYCGIGHDVIIGDFVTLSTDAQVGSFSTIGNYSFIGNCAVIYPGIKIGKGAIISAGAIVKSDVPEYGSIY